MEKLILQYPAWYLLLCLALAVAGAVVLYYWRDKSFADVHPMWKRGMALLRGLALFLICLLLLSPLLRTVTEEVKKPIVVIAADNSESIRIGMDSSARKSLSTDLNALAANLSDDYEVHQFAFGNEFRETDTLQWKEKRSNLGGMFQYVADLYTGQNLGAVVMASDGIFNVGPDPLYADARLTAPVFTVALGDTTPKKDLVLKRVFHNNIAYLGDKFTIQADVSARNLAGTSTTLSISRVEGDKLVPLGNQSFPITSNDFFLTRDLIVDATKAGVQRFRLTLSKATGEQMLQNNSRDIYVEVLDARQKILVLGAAPHPDLSALKQSIERNKNYQVSVATLAQLVEPVTAYDLVILHQIPSQGQDATAILKQLDDKGIPRWFIVGANTDFNKIRTVQQAVAINADARQTNDIQAAIAPGFSLFTISEALARELPNFAPLKAPFGDFKENSSQVLLYQRIGRIDTKYPLLAFQDVNGLRTAVLTAENIWQWRLFDFLQHQNHDRFDELVTKTVQYLSVRQDKRRFRVVLPRMLMDENERIVFDAELYNNSFELVNDPDVRIVITNSSGKQYNYTFSKSGKAYRLDAGLLPVGNYTFKANTTLGGQQLNYQGQFSIQPIQLEVYETTANHAVLRNLAQQYGGNMVFANQIASIEKAIRDNKQVKPVAYATMRTRPIIDLKWIFFLLFVLLGAEWFLRRYLGSY